MKKIPFSLSLATVWLILITVLLCLPGATLPNKNWFSTIQLDKWIHIGLFGTLVFVWCGAFRERINDPLKLKNSFVATCFLAIGYGVLMEFVQDGLIPNRSFDEWDIASDAAGSLAGMFLAMRYFK